MRNIWKLLAAFAIVGGLAACNKDKGPEGPADFSGGCSASPSYEIASPLYPETVIHLGGRYGRGEEFRIIANNVSRKAKYVQSATLNGRPLNSFRFPAGELLAGGELVLEMGEEPAPLWGTN